ncbi:hypothetical protein [Streptomyces sp. NPDC020571]|uniref:hypothetical protein n=1 Tax=Streptomyces sp. NPDC020571 TaxID=3365079 RepID=UPI0037A4E5DB
MEQHAENEDDHTTDAAEERGPDVFLDVPQLKVDELDLDVENLRARVSLQAEVLDLLKLNVGADVALGQVHLGISGVEAQAQLKVRLDNVALIINRVLTTLDRNPQILEDLARGIGNAVQDVGEGAGSAVEDIGGSAGEALGEVAQGVGEVGAGAGDAALETGRVAGRSVRRTAQEAGVGEAAGKTARRAGGTAGSVTRTDHGTHRTASPGASGGDSARRRRTRDDESGATRPLGRRGARKREEPP